MSLIIRAQKFAKEKHKHQKRKYTGEPYFNHCEEVAYLVGFESLLNSNKAVAAAYLHDVVEDTETSIEEIEEIFGKTVAQLVSEVTDISKTSDGNRKARKEIDRKHLEKASPEGQTIKLADLISNSISIVECDKDFAKVYLAEKEKLLEVLIYGDRLLFLKAKTILKKAMEQLAITDKLA